MSKHLVIIESPGKVKKISQILGSKYVVKPTIGHLTLIPTKSFSINLDTFEANYIYNSKKSKVMLELKKAAESADIIYFASDPDRAGERIAFDAANLLNIKTPKRLIFHEITKTAITSAINNPKTLDINIINSQKAQESLDYIIGLKVSPLMSRFLSIFGLGAGRCMSVYTELIYDNQKEIDKFQDNSDKLEYKINCSFNYNSLFFSGKLNQSLLKEEVINFINQSKTSKFTIDKLKTKEQLNYPHPPLTTLELQKIASNSAGFSPQMTMKLAQSLYEKGIISYIRTDSVLLPDEILLIIKSLIPDGYDNIHQYTNKMKTAQEGHSAIYPIHVEIENPTNLSGGEQRLYTLIRQYTIASQMKPEINKVFTFNINISNSKYYYEVSLKTQVFKGYKIIFNETPQNYTLEQLTSIKNNDLVNPINLHSEQIINEPPKHYSESAFISKVEKLEIGRPSTMATLIDKIQRCGYIKKDNISGKQKTINIIQYDYKNNNQQEENKQILIGAETNKFIITDLGIKTTEYLLKYFVDIMNYNFTADMENKLSLIADGKETYINVMKSFYSILLQNLLVAGKIKVIKLNQLVGKYNNNDVFLKEGRYSQYLVCDKTKCSLKDLSDTPINDDLIKKLFDEKLHPEINKVGEYQNIPIILKTGRFGPYIQWNDKNISLKGFLPKNYIIGGNNTEELDNDKLIELIKSKTPLKEFKCGNIYNGPYGIYIKDAKNPKRMVSIPKDLDINTIDEAKAEELVKSWKPKRIKK